ncbi:hypothetical protein [Brevibacterium aurantiacum]|uniref:hypothetical protein n=1 Tax=Brevibacterium aurantiacum TaxID=273384 RepID=UPI001865D8E1|nr:hypothetical protein [Brevibacterium aurantiacum]
MNFDNNGDPITRAQEAWLREFHETFSSLPSTADLDLAEGDIDVEPLPVAQLRRESDYSHMVAAIDVMDDEVQKAKAIRDLQQCSIRDQRRTTFADLRAVIALSPVLTTMLTEDSADDLLDRLAPLVRPASSQLAQARLMVKIAARRAIATDDGLGSFGNRGRGELDHTVLGDDLGDNVTPLHRK